MVGAGLGLAIVQASLERVRPHTVSLVDLPRGFDIKMAVHLASGAERSPAAEVFFNICG